MLGAACSGQDKPPAAQEPAKAEDKAAQDAGKTAAPAAAQSPAPPADQWLNGSIDFGYRWLTDVKGSFQEYRTVVNLGEGPKLFGVDFTIQDPKKRAFDRMDVQAYGWGGEPYTTAHLNARKQGVYDLNADYRNIAMFLAEPSFANPFAPGGFDEQMFDTRRRTGTIQLDLRPGKRITPYLAYERNSGTGHGIETWVQEFNNAFAVPTTLNDSTNNYRGGVRFEFNRFHVTLEQGGTTFKDNDQAFWSGVNLGDRTTPLLGVTSMLNGLVQAYGIRVSGPYEKGLFTARPASWIDLYGQFLFSQPKTSAHYTDLAYGQFANVTSLLLYSGQQTTATGAVNQPHTSANFGFEVRPLRRVRIIESLLTDRFHDAASSFIVQQLLSPNQTNLSALVYGQYVNFNQQQTDVLVDVTKKLTLRGGFRYVWGDASVLAGELSQTGNLVQGQLNRKIGLAGLTYRPWQKLSVNLDYEGSSSDSIYFRTSLNDYNRARARARYQVTSSLMLQTNFTILNNQNPAPDIRLDFQSRTNTLSMYWTPGGSKRFSMTGEYDRSTVRSDILYLGLFLAPMISSYRDNAHVATSAIDVTLPELNGTKLTLGGSLFISSGSRPTSYYQPLTRIAVPIGKHVFWNTEWRYYGLGETFYTYEGFRVHVFQTGLRVTQ
jgi:hypothetical protein